MAVTIDATVGGTSANSFATLAEFTAYMEGRLNSDDFDDATDDTKNRALVDATREISGQRFIGYKASTSQALSWPRAWADLPPEDATWPGAQWYTTTEIPQRVKDATMELAFQFLVAGTTDLASLDPNDGVIEKTVDVLTTRWQPYQKPTQGLQRFPRVYNRLRPLLLGSSAQLVRG